MKCICRWNNFQASLTFYFVGMVHLFFVSCSYNHNDNKQNQKNHFERNGMDSMSIKIHTPVIKLEDTFDLVLYRPENLSIDFVQIRPSESDSTIFLCIPAAFTSLNTTIDGFSIEKGLITNYNFNQMVKGGFGLISDSCYYYNFMTTKPDSIFNKIIKNTGDFFQQLLLVFNKKAIVNTLFGKRVFQCRAICQIGHETFIAESVANLNINEFSQRLLKIGVENAVYTDMGGWSEGWYRINSQKIIAIGKTKTQTKKQTNWIVFKVHD